VKSENGFQPGTLATLATLATQTLASPADEPIVPDAQSVGAKPYPQYPQYPQNSNIGDCGDIGDRDRAPHLAVAPDAPIVPALTSEDHEAIAEAIAERAAVREYDGGEHRDVAERNARASMRAFRYRLTDKPRSWLVLIAPSCDLTEARRHLALRFGERLLDVVEHRPGMVRA